MRNKLIIGLLVFVLLFSFPGFSQTTEESKHPLLDKYYPRKQDTDTSKTITTIAKPMVDSKPLVETNPVPQAKQVAQPKPLAPAYPVAETKPAMQTEPVPQTEPAPEMKPATAVTVAPPVIETPPATAPADQQATIATPPPPRVPEKVSAPQPTRGPLLNSSRLGSSTKQYDTWEKNNNGAGSVTTSPK